MFEIYELGLALVRIKPHPLPLLNLTRDSVDIEILPLLAPGNLKLMGAAMAALQSGASLPEIFRQELRK